MRGERNFSIIGAGSAYETVYSYKYDSKGNVFSVEDHRNSKVTVYEYDHENKPIRTYEYDSETYYYLYSVKVSYDEESRVAINEITFDYTYSNYNTYFDKIAYGYSYDNTTGNIDSISIDSGVVSDYSLNGYINPVYDNFGRTTSKTIDFNIAGEDAFYNKLTYEYDSGPYYYESSRISKVTNKIGISTSEELISTTYNYTYDANGNITQIKNAGGVIQYKYTYDDLGQLTREDNRPLGYSYTYTYDNAGNITSKKRYAFTTGTLGTALETINYTYGNSDWGDLLTRYDGELITYDAIGNPRLLGEYILSWECEARDYTLSA